MERRRFLQVMAAGAAGAALPRLVFAGNRDDPAAIERDQRVLRKAIERATKRARPLLFVIAPAREEDEFVRGDLFGRWLALASPELLCDLAIVDGYCAKYVDLARAGLVPAESKSEPWLALVETRDDAAVAAVLDVDPMAIALEPRVLESGDVYRDDHARRDALAKALADALDWKSTHAARADACVRALSKADRASLDSPFMSRDLLERAAAYLRDREGVDAKRAAASAPVLGAIATAMWITRSPSGLMWRTFSACSLDPNIDRGAREPNSFASGGAGGCGMSQLPDESSRFLWFLSGERE